MLKSIVLIGNAKEVPNSVKGNEGKEFVTLDLAVTIKSKCKESTDWVELICNGFWGDLPKNILRLVVGYLSMVRLNLVRIWLRMEPPNPQPKYMLGK